MARKQSREAASRPSASPAPAPPVGPTDRVARDRIESEFARNFLVEAGAGSGKTRSLARRMAAGIASGHYAIEHMAAVTFTRKAAAELRGRFQEALEDRLAGCPDPAGRPTRPPTAEERTCLEEALRGIERLFAGTIHAFCAHLLRERPVEARVAPGFVELDEVEDASRRAEAWREFLVRERARGSKTLAELQAAGVRPRELDGAFAKVCENEDVAFPAEAIERPDVEAAWKALERFWARLAPLVPDEIPPDAKCPVLKVAADFGGRFDYARRWRRDAAMLAEFYNDWKRGKVSMTWWGATGRQAKTVVEAFRQDTLVPFVTAWRHYVYRLAVTLLCEGRSFYADERRRQNVVNYVDLLLVVARLLRERPAVRRSLQQKYRWFFIDEFQDTDPIQAEIFLLLASQASDAGDDAFAMPLVPGSLFVVGDPKQSIYRFRRADIDIYNRVRERIRACGGEVLHLTANWRSLPGVCALANSVFPTRFPTAPSKQSPAFEPLDPQRVDPEGATRPRVARLVVPADVERTDVPAWEAERVARYIETEVAAGRRQYGSFLLLTRYKPRLAHYADAFDRHRIPVEVSGAGRFGGSAQVAALAALLSSLADPLDGAALVGVLRGPLFGIADDQLFEFRQKGGRFELAGAEQALPPGSVVSAAIEQLRGWRTLTRRLPLGAAVDRILDESGWLALAAASPGGAKAGDLLQAVDWVRRVFESGEGLADAADALRDDEDVPTEVEALPLEPGKRNVVRLMNLHKAKGLEADVVFLADPANGKAFEVDSRIVREQGQPVGYLKLIRKPEGSFIKVTLGEPADWNAHEAEETRYRDAEIDRLLYVASTRARDLLVVGQWTKTGAHGKSQNDAWGAFDGFLTHAPALVVPDAVPDVTREAIDVSPAARNAARQARERAHDAARRSSWVATSVTGEHAPIRTRAARVRDAMGAAADAEAAAPVAGALPPVSESARGPGPPTTGVPLAVDTPTDLADAGAAWGSLVHGLLEHAMRRADTTRAELERLARWLTVETPELRSHLAEAIDVVLAVAGAEVWRQARGAADCQVEVPFAILVEAMASGAPALSGPVTPAATPSAVPTVLRGVIDLVYRAPEGWRIVDYKTDRTGGDVGLLVARHAGQLASYVDAWAKITGERGRAGIFGVRDLAMAWDRR